MKTYRKTTLTLSALAGIFVHAAIANGYTTPPYTRKAQIAYDLRLADSTWGLSSCDGRRSVTDSHIDTPAQDSNHIVAGETAIENCAITLDSGITDPVWLCTVIVHEVGHLHAPYINAHSPDPHSVMYWAPKRYLPCVERYDSLDASHAAAMRVQAVDPLHRIWVCVANRCGLTGGSRRIHYWSEQGWVIFSHTPRWARGMLIWYAPYRRLFADPAQLSTQWGVS